MPLERVAVIGAGAWGTALAQAAAMAGRYVSLVARNEAVIAEINARRTNSAYLGALQLSDRISAAPALAEGTELVILAVPAQASRKALTGLGASALEGLPVVLSAKGLETGTLLRQSEILAQCAPGARAYVLSGPSFAHDVAAGRPTAVTLAGSDREETETIAAALAGPSFRPYAADDLLGVELVGALKNVYALACGAVEGAGLGASARAALIARAYAELGRLVVAAGGSAQTLGGLAGLGDLTLSCTSAQSRNYSQGMALGRDEPLRPGGALAEGVATAPVAQAMARRLGVDAPLVDAVNLLLDRDVSITQILSGLMARPLKRED
ncbi:NAD(P)H-dependent glycerol-3-phosphate dehydrogenase [Arsenicitalea aurantiaca]|uniref:Glycerol-3-phosphate dehydrogenase [NAD(P)+] n=1 Tax=Arsenicitalea aurantiaca TaxID=1783274 RepID=A0A433X5M5_9HYPH|nr:NAD(P)H-dependent glycerol-3-phosphate dehydrogenase [Arsenicitalea aurantiaca]RUT29347.1 NAD(P)H-dependent glycerol-3-phosphate dehydrogenase [Arsenicitalea aurantiaca]